MFLFLLWFFSWYSNRNYEFCGRIKKLCNNCSNKSIIKKKKRKHDKVVLLAKSKSNSIEVLISKASVDSVISHDKFVLMNNMLKEYNKMKEEIKKFKDLISLSKILIYLLNNVIEKIQKVKIQKLHGKKRKNNAIIKLCSM